MVGLFFLFFWQGLRFMELEGRQSPGAGRKSILYIICDNIDDRIIVLFFFFLKFIIVFFIV